MVILAARIAHVADVSPEIENSRFRQCRKRVSAKECLEIPATRILAHINSY